MHSTHHIVFVYHVMEKYRLCYLKYKAHTVGKDTDTYCLNAYNDFPIHLQFHITI